MFYDPNDPTGGQGNQSNSGGQRGQKNVKAAATDAAANVPVTNVVPAGDPYYANGAAADDIAKARQARDQLQQKFLQYQGPGAPQAGRSVIGGVNAQTVGSTGYAPPAPQPLPPGALPPKPRDPTGSNPTGQGTGGPLAGANGGFLSYAPEGTEEGADGGTGGDPSSPYVAQSAQVNLAPAAQTDIPVVGNAVSGSAGNVAAGQVGPADQYASALIERTQGAQSARLNNDFQQQLRNQQLGLFGDLKGAASGAGPSAAQAQLQEGFDQAIAAQKGQAAGVSGPGAITAQLGAANNIAALQQRAATGAAQLKANEVATARQQLGSGLQGAREQDIGVAGTQAGFEQQVNLANASADQVRALNQAQLQQSAAQGNAAAVNELQKRQAELTQEAGTTNAQLGTQTSLANAAAQNEMSKLQAQIQLQGGIANADQQNQMAKLQGQLTQQTNLSNAGEINTTARTQQAADLQTNLANLDARLKQQGLDTAARQQLLDAYLKNQQEAVGWDTSQSAINLARRGQDIGVVGSVVKGITDIGAVAAALSDRRAKKDIRKASDRDLDDLVDSMRAHVYRYKDGLGSPGVKLGPMAQELQKSKLGRGLVSKGDDGLLRVDTGGLALAMSAVVARMAQKPENRT